VYGLPPERVWVSVYEKDDEAYALWRDVVGVPEERIRRMGAEDNFWASGPTGEAAGGRSPGGQAAVLAAGRRRDGRVPRQPRVRPPSSRRDTCPRALLLKPHPPPPPPPPARPPRPPGRPLRPLQ
jgi:hypothetical protein